MAISVRRATLDDAAAIAAVHVASWEGAYRGLVPDAWFEERTLPARSAMWRRVLDEPRTALVLVAEDDGATVGLASANLPSRDADADEDTAEISAFYAACGFVADDARQGVPPEIRLCRPLPG